MDMVIFEENKPKILKAMENGDFDYIEAASEVCETEFFRFIDANSMLGELAGCYPSPRENEEVPLWVYLASNISLRLHGEHAFHAYPLIVRIGGMLNAFGPQMGRKVVDGDQSKVTLDCKGFNEKNRYDRESPCHQDFLRKMAKDTDADALTAGWFGRDVLRAFHRRGAFDEEGILIGDASYLFVPDNENYEDAANLRFDESDHPVSREAYEKMSPEQQARCRWRRCYKIVTLLHTNRTMDYFLFVGLKVLPGSAHESPVLYELVDHLVAAVGQGVMKRLILDRGFLDGAAIAHCKSQHEIDLLIPVRRNMDIYEDAMALFRLPEVNWVPVKAPKPRRGQGPRHRPLSMVKGELKRQATLRKKKGQKPLSPEETNKVLAKTLVRTEVAAIGGFRSWSTCTVPLTVVATREHYGDGHQKTWLLLDTQPDPDPVEVRQEYRLRTGIEERYRQLKCFSGLANFTSCAFSLVVNQVVFVLLTYNLLQFYLRQQGLEDLAGKPLPLAQREMLPSVTNNIVYWQCYCAFFTTYELVELTARVSAKARKKIAAKSRHRQRELMRGLRNPRPG